MAAILEKICQGATRYYATEMEYPCGVYHEYYVLHVHPCEKVIGIYFRHKFFIIYFLSFALVFIHDIYEVVNIKSVNFCWISIIGYTSVTF